VILRLTALLALALGLMALLGFLQLLGEAPWSPPEMRHLRAMKNRTTAPDSVTPYTLDELGALPHRLPLAAYSPLEQRGVSFTAYVQRMLIAPDGDTHLELTATPRLPGGPDTCYASAEITPQWHEGSARWAYESLVASLRPNVGGATPWDSGPRRARISGWLLYDFQYDGVASSEALRSGARVTGWEIHPVTRIELWSDSLQRFVDLPQ
jgi:hypothetical protein